MFSLCPSSPSFLECLALVTRAGSTKYLAATADDLLEVTYYTA
jgi:hypothetical protein